MTDDDKFKVLVLGALQLLLSRMLYPPASCDHEGRLYYDYWREQHKELADKINPERFSIW